MLTCRYIEGHHIYFLMRLYQKYILVVKNEQYFCFSIGMNEKKQEVNNIGKLSK